MESLGTKGNTVKMDRSEWQKILDKVQCVFRENQFQGAAAIDKFYGSAMPEDPQSLLFEAPTGIGKTLMYLGPLPTWHVDDVKAVISTSGKLLQHQIADFASQKLGMNPVILMGRANYICQSACRYYFSEMPEDHSLRNELELLFQWLDASSELSELTKVLKLETWSNDFINFMRQHLTASSKFCRDGHNGKNAKCFYTELFRKAQNSSLLILNHHALFSIGVNDLFAGKVLVADEAHALPEAASSVFSLSVSTSQLRTLQNRAEMCKDACPNAVRRFKDMLERLIEIISAGETSVPNVNFWDDFATRTNFLAKDAFPLGGVAPFYRAILGELNDSWQEIYDFICQMPVKAKTNNGVCYFETGLNKTGCLKYSPIETAPLLTQFWAQWSETIGLSATLTMPGAETGHEFDYFQEKCGFPKPMKPPLILPTPFKLHKQCIVFIPENGTDYDFRAEQNIELFLKIRILLAGSLIKAFNGRTLSLYTAAKRLECASAVLNPLFSGQILTQGDNGTDNDEMAHNFIEDPQKVLLGTKSFFQGFDAPGETLCCEILEKLPFLRRDDPILEAKCRNAGDNWFKQVILPAMLMELRQAFGRLIRNENDRGIFILADSRFRQKDYVAAVEQAFGGATIKTFTSPADLLSQIPEGFLPFKLAEIAGFEDSFNAEWKIFRETPLFRRIAGLKTVDEIRNKLQVNTLYDWQKTIIDRVLAGVLAQFVIYPAGSGKSLTYQIPALMRPGLTLVVSPLRALMYDQVEALRQKGVTEAAFYNSDLTFAEQLAIKGRLQQGKIRLLYVAPERLHQNFVNFLLSLPQGIAMLVIDEAHMISEAGTQWRPFYGELPHAWEQLGKPQVLAVTATAGSAVKNDIISSFAIPSEYVYEKSVVRNRVKISVNQVCNVAGHCENALNFVRQAGGNPVLIYCSQINFVHDLRTCLQKNGIRAAMYYTGLDNFGNALTPAQLQQKHRDFMTNSVQVLIATSAYGMGIDKPDIWGVLYNNVPASLEELVQGAGRVCRDRNLLRRHAEQHAPASVSITYNHSDLHNEWIENDFNNIKSMADEHIIPGMLLSMAFSESEFLYSCSQAGGNTLDEDKLRTCILLARFMRERELLDTGSFDWKRSEFNFSGIKEMPKKADFNLWLDTKMGQRINQLRSVRNFCTSTGCRNEFLQVYFTGNNAKRQCHCCDRCGYSLAGHLEYIEAIGAIDGNGPARFTNGNFNAGGPHFLTYLRGITAAESPAQIGYLHREHRETGRGYSDAEFAADLLALKYGKHDAAWVLELFDRLIPVFNQPGQPCVKQQNLFAFGIECNIPNLENLFHTCSKLRDFGLLHKNDNPMQISQEILRECDCLGKELREMPDTGFRNALEVLVKEKIRPFSDFILNHDWCACVYFIHRGSAFEDLYNENAEAEAEAWRRLSGYLRQIVGWEENDPDKFCFLCDLVKSLPDDQKREWNLILKAPEDFLKLATKDSTVYHENYWESEWFCNSKVSQSNFLRCREIGEDITVYEADKATEQMPVGEWRDIISMMPYTAILCPEWTPLLTKLQENEIAPHSETLSQKLSGDDVHLPDILKFFLKSKVNFGVMPDTTPRGKNVIKSKEIRLSSLDQLSVDFLKK